MDFCLIWFDGLSIYFAIVKSLPLFDNRIIL